MCIYIYIYTHKCRDSIVVRVLGWDMKVPGSIPVDINYMGCASDTSKSLGECLRLRSNHNLDLTGRLAESKKKRNVYVYRPFAELRHCQGRLLIRGWGGGYTRPRLMNELDSWICAGFTSPPQTIIYIYIYIYIYI